MSTIGLAALAYTPFIDPVNLHKHWYLLLIPMALGVALAYKAVRVPNLRDYPRQVLVMTVQIVVAMISLGAASYFFVQYLVPLIVARS